MEEIHLDPDFKKPKGMTIEYRIVDTKTREVLVSTNIKRRFQKCWHLYNMNPKRGVSWELKYFYGN